MKNCTDCKWADWKKTAAGKLHPSGDGNCAFPFKLPPLPAAMFWPRNAIVYGGHINRRTDLPEHCAYFARSDS